MIPTLDFLLPSLHPSTLLDVTFPLTAPGKTGEPVVRQLSIKHGDHEPVGVVKRMLSLGDGRVGQILQRYICTVTRLTTQVMLADDGFRMSTLQLKSIEETGPPEVVKQEKVAHKAGNTWSSLTAVNG